MKILFDHQTFQQQKFGGISRYFFELMNYYSNLEELQNISFDLTSYNVQNTYLKSAKFAEGKKTGLAIEYFLGKKPFPGRGRLYRLLCRKGIIAGTEQVPNDKVMTHIENTNYDIFHPTYYDDYFLPRIKKPFVVTVYDMIHQLFPDYFRADDLVLMKKKKILTQARHIIAISENTKRDIIDYYNINENKISVVHLASSIPDALAQAPEEKLPDRYILFVGMRGFYKNFIFFLRSIAPILRQEKDLYLVCAGSGGFNPLEVKLINELELGHKIRLILFQSDSELKFIYQNAQVFVYPSQYEGFGIPLLEAFGSNCPVICSRASSFAEVAGDAALYVDPINAASIGSAVNEVLKSDHFKNELRAKGTARLAQFSWEKCAKEHLLVYKKTLQENS